MGSILAIWYWRCEPLALLATARRCGRLLFVVGSMHLRWPRIVWHLTITEQGASFATKSRGRVSPRLAITAIKSRYPSRRGVIFLANVAESLCNSASLLDQRRSFSLVSTSRGATRPQKITASERRTYVPKVSALWLRPTAH